MRIGDCVLAVGSACCAVLLSACGPDLRLEEKLAEMGGAKELRKACEEVWPDPKDRVETNSDMFKHDELPEHCALRSLRPQFVSLNSYGPVMMYDIQTSGGFYHAGYLVTVNADDHVDVKDVPRSDSWKVRSMGDGVFTYEE